MTAPNTLPRSARPIPDIALSPAETARYTRDLIESLRKIAVRQGQSLLAHLLGLAAMEAKALADGNYSQETRLPE